MPKYLETTPSLERVELTNKPLLIITEKLQAQINYLHMKERGKEWSGELITKEVNTINDLSNWTIIAEELFLADIGSAAFTGYEVDKGGFKPADIIEMYTAFPGLEDGTYKNHHIHTHHNMGAFFSGTDWENLHDRALVSNYFLMLIVNNSGEYVAKVAFKAEEQTPESTKLVFANNHDGFEPFTLTGGKKRSVLVVMDCKIQYMTEPVMEQSFIDRYEKVKKVIEEESKSKYPSGLKGSYYDNFLKKNDGWGFRDKKDKIGYKRKKGNMYFHDDVPPTGDLFGFMSDDKKDTKKISEMTDKEWEESQKETDSKREDFTDKEIFQALTYNVLGYFDEKNNYSLFREHLDTVKKKVTTDKKMDETVDAFSVDLYPTYMSIFGNRKSNGEEDYYDYLLAMKACLKKNFSMFPIVEKYMGCLDEEMDATRDLIYEKSTFSSHSSYGSPFI